MRNPRRRLDAIEQEIGRRASRDALQDLRTLGLRIMADPEALNANLEQFRFICEHARERGYPREPWQETASLAFRLPHAEEMLLRTTAIIERATRCAAPL